MRRSGYFDVNSAAAVVPGDSADALAKDEERIEDSKRLGESFDAALREEDREMHGKDHSNANLVSRTEGEVASSFVVVAVVAAACSWRMKLGMLGGALDLQLMSVCSNHRERMCRVFGNGALHKTSHISYFHVRGQVVEEGTKDIGHAKIGSSIKIWLLVRKDLFAAGSKLQFHHTPSF